MTKPVADGHQIHASLKEVHGCGVAHGVGVDPLRLQGRDLGFGARHVLGEEIARAKPRQGLPALIAEQRFPASSLLDQRRKDLGGLGPKGT